MDRKQLALRMFSAHRLFLQKFVSTQLMAGNISELQTREIFALESLGERPWISMSELSAILNTAANTTTGIVDRMVRRDLFLRRQSEKDRRVVEIALTEKGQEVYQAYLALHQDYIEGLMVALTQEETEQYAALIEKLVQKLKSQEGGS